MSLTKNPVLFLVFNRADTTKRVFEAIRAARPSRLYVAADSARPERQGEAELCAEVRKIATAVDWPCELKTLFREKHQSCRKAVSSAVTWFFENEPQGIILEDDCLPSDDFFRFCDELLERYRDDERVFHIGGGNFQLGRRRGEASYYFSQIPHIWGWASWRRAWKLYDVDMATFPEFSRQKTIRSLFPRQLYAQRRWFQIFRRTYDKAPCYDTWDHQWTYTLLSQRGLSIIPNNNMISNIGFKTGGFHTPKGTESPFDSAPHSPLPEKIIHPNLMAPCLEADRFSFNIFFHEPLHKILRRELGYARYSFLHRHG